jgi:UbiD family decarboxylase
MIATSDAPAIPGTPAGLVPARDFREALAWAEADGEVVRITREVEPHLGSCAVAAAFRTRPNKPVLLFDNLSGYPGIRGTYNFYASARRLSRALGMPGVQAADKRSFLHALAHPVAPVMVDTAPCQENVITGEIDLGRMFPAIHGATHVTSLYFQPVTVLRNPHTGIRNTAMYRCALQGPDRITVNARWDQHSGYLIHDETMEPAPLPVPVALCLGVHPALAVAGITKMGFGEDEMGFAGGILREPIELVKCKTIDLEVPARAEVVIEGEIRPPFTRGSEGPWPEYLRYLGGETHPPIMTITAVTYRDNPIVDYQIPGATPHLAAIGAQAAFLRYLRNIAGSFVVDCHIPPGTIRHTGSIKVRKAAGHYEGLLMNVALGAFGFYNSLDLIILVDEDVNITDMNEIEWAITTRCDPLKQVHILGPGLSQAINPIAGIKEAQGNAPTKGKWIIDATAPWDIKTVQKGEGIGFFTRSEWPAVDPADYLSPADAQRWLQP